MNQSSKRIISILLSAVIIIAAVVVYSVFVVPAYADINQLRSELSGKQDILDEQRVITERVSELLTRYQSIPQLEEVLSLAIPNTEDIASAFNQIHTLAGVSGLLVDQFGANTSLALRPNNDESEANLRNRGTVQLEFTLIGSYGGIKSFVQAIESNIRIMDLVEVRMDNASKNVGNTFVASLVVNAYYQSK